LWLTAFGRGRRIARGKGSDMLEERINFTLEEMDKQSLFHPLTSIAQHMKAGPLIWPGCRSSVPRRCGPGDES
jgi:hypothetical protein